MTTVGFIGTGNMAGAIARGITARGFAEAKDVVLFDLTPAKAQALADEVGGARVARDAQALVAASDIVVLAVKPNVVAQALAPLGQDLRSRGSLLVSIAAGWTVARLEEQAGAGTAIVRVMPNVNATVGAAITALTANAAVSPDQRAVAIRLFEAVGDVVELDEKLFSAFTAIAGSSPAFTFVYIDALARAAVEAGMTKAVATRVAAQAVLGSARLLLETGDHPWALVDTVSSPGGTTVAGLLALENRAFLGTVVDGVRATIARDRELGA